MARAVLWAGGLACAVSLVSAACAPSDNREDCEALQAFGISLGWQKWTTSDGWMGSGSVCTWYGVSCDASGRVTSIVLKDNGLNGTIPDAIGNITHLTSLDLSGARPPDYNGCVSSDVHNTSIPDSLFGLTNLTLIILEYMCLGGEISSKIGFLTNLVEFSIHGNFVRGVIPTELNRLTQMTRLKLGRNPLSGGFPDVRALTKLTTFACNFAALTGPILDIFDSFPDLEITFWDGNGFTGPLPKSIGKLTKLQSLSFNINKLTGPVPSEWSALASSGVLTDCRIGADTNLTAYLANYWWIPRPTGNVYSCPLPSFAMGSGVCNHVTNCEDVKAPCSPVKCN